MAVARFSHFFHFLTHVLLFLGCDCHVLFPEDSLFSSSPSTSSKKKEVFKSCG